MFVGALEVRCHGEELVVFVRPVNLEGLLRSIGIFAS
jgi:hypothetical protein